MSRSIAESCDIRRIFTITVIIMLLFGSISILPVLAQSQDSGEIDEDILNEIEQNFNQEAEELDIYRTLTDHVYVQKANWRPKENKVRLTLVADQTTKLSFIDEVHSGELTPIQHYTISQGTTTISVNARSQGIGEGVQKLKVSTDNYEIDTPLQNSPGVDFSLRVEFALALVVIIIIFYLTSKIVKKRVQLLRRRGVYDIVDQEWIRLVWPSEDIDRTTWGGKIKYAWVRFKEIAESKFIKSKNPLIPLIGLSAILIGVDALAFNHYILYSIQQTEFTREYAFAAIISTAAGWWYAYRMKDLWGNYTGREILSLDFGQIPTSDELKGETTKEMLEEISEDETKESLRLVKMSNEVYQEFDNLIDTRPKKIKYGDGENEHEFYVVRRMDLDKKEILNTVESLPKSIIDVSKYILHAKENNRYLKSKWQKIELFMGALPVIMERLREESAKNVAEELERAFRKQEELDVEKAVENMMENANVEADERDHLQKFKDAINPDKDTFQESKGDQS